MASDIDPVALPFGEQAQEKDAQQGAVGDAADFKGQPEEFFKMAENIGDEGQDEAEDHHPHPGNEEVVALACPTGKSPAGRCP